ncbi:hypothetical protein IWX78_001160 [Mycetocola sp. CAN_C7]|uniref:hypothetical protein n=1 Tax=Mycetocola sp. CAN_C7 TaxID=2787724 RepID=UPI0018CA4372
MSNQSNVGMTIDDMRAAARTLAYPNTETERANIKRIDEEIFEKVRVLENGILANATEFITNSAVDLTAASEFTDAILEDVVYALDTSNPDVDAIAGRYEQLRGQAERVAKTLERLDREAAWHAQRVEDPYGSYVSLVSKYPTLRPSIRLQ